MLYNLYVMNVVNANNVPPQNESKITIKTGHLSKVA